MDKKYILYKFKEYRTWDKRPIECEVDASEIVNDFICREGFYGKEVYDFLMEELGYKQD